MASASSPKPTTPVLTDWLILALLWSLSASFDGLWLWLDHAPPAWDQADHLTKAMNHWRLWQHPQITSEDWWRELWMQAPTQRAPLVYLLTVPFFAIAGSGFDQARLVNSLLTGVLMISVYWLGRHCFSRQVGLWAAGLCVLSPLMAAHRIDYLLDYGLTVMFGLTFASLTVWRNVTKGWQGWLWAIWTGICIGLTFMTRTSALLFLVVPLVWLMVELPWQRKKGRLLELVLMLVVSWVVIAPWFTTGWLTIISTTVESTSHGITYRNDPQANTLAGWLFYARSLPGMVSPIVFFTAIGCGLTGWLGPWLRQRWGKQENRSVPPVNAPKNLWWLVGILLGFYLLGSLGANKQPRLWMPALPIVLLWLAHWLTLGKNRWWQGLRWGAVIISALLLIASRFPLPGLATLVKEAHFPDTGPAWPHQAVIAEVIRSQPYQRSTIGLVANTAEINPMNIDFYGAVANFQVYGRQLAFSEKTAQQDSRSLDWYLTKTGEQGAYDTIEAGQKALKQLVENSPELVLHRTWPLPDASELRLYRRRQLSTIVEPLKADSLETSKQGNDRIKLDRMTLPKAIPPGQTAPITYELSGPWSALQDGLLLLSWQLQTPSGSFAEKPAKSPLWLHDHGIGLGNLHTGNHSPAPQSQFKVLEQLATLPPPSLPPGTYRLTADYLNRKTQETYSIALPALEVQVDPKAVPQPAPELDLITQFRQLARGLPVGKLDPVFAEIGRINQYDPTQDYLLQAEQVWRYRLQTTPSTELAYPLGLIYVLQRRAEPAIDTFRQITELDANNPWAWAYLGFLHLYSWEPHLADIALNQAATLDPNLPEVKTLQGVAAALKLNLPKAWRLLKG